MSFSWSSLRVLIRPKISQYTLCVRRKPFQVTIFIFSSSGVNLTPYSGVIFWGSYFNSKKEFKELFFRSKNHP